MKEHVSAAGKTDFPIWALLGGDVLVSRMFVRLAHSCRWLHSGALWAEDVRPEGSGTAPQRWGCQLSGCSYCAFFRFRYLGCADSNQLGLLVRKSPDFLQLQSLVLTAWQLFVSQVFPR